MPTITGPLIQVPPSGRSIVDEAGNVRMEWQAFFNAGQQIMFNISRSGPTASRPTSKLDGRYVGMPYFDTTLGLTISLKSVNPDVWVNGAGVPV
jgi:hypothetical protein